MSENNEIKELDKTEQHDEYQDLITELKELKDEEEREIEQIEEETNDYETKIQLENEQMKFKSKKSIHQQKPSKKC